MKTQNVKGLMLFLTIGLVGVTQAWAQLNTSYGTQALYNTTTSGIYNAAFGNYALYYNTNGKYNTGVGFKALYYNVIGNENTAIGYYALLKNTNGVLNTATGSNAMFNNDVGFSNSAYGVSSLYTNHHGNYNTASGVSSLYSNYSGSYNTASGYNSLYTNASGSYNTAMGTGSLYYNTYGESNTAVGAWAMTTNRIGFYNTGIGSYSLYDLSGGGSNTAVGYNTGRGIVGGYNNTIIGANVTGLPASLTNNIILADGLGNRRLQIDGNGKTRIGDPSLTTPGTYKLYVEDGILTEKVVIALANSTQWADYVFAPDYKLMPLSEVAGFVKENHHLPNVPAAEEVVKNGVDVAAMNAKLLEKIEELTLYLIGQHQQHEALQQQVAELKEKLAKLETGK